MVEEGLGGCGGGGLYQEHVSASTNKGAKVSRLSGLGVGLLFIEDDTEE